MEPLSTEDVYDNVPGHDGEDIVPEWSSEEEDEKAYRDSIISAYDTHDSVSGIFAPDTRVREGSVTELMYMTQDRASTLAKKQSTLAKRMSQNLETVLGSDRRDGNVLAHDRKAVIKAAGKLLAADLHGTGPGATGVGADGQASQRRLEAAYEYDDMVKQREGAGDADAKGYQEMPEDEGSPGLQAARARGRRESVAPYEYNESVRDTKRDSKGYMPNTSSEALLVRMSGDYSEIPRHHKEPRASLPNVLSTSSLVVNPVDLPPRSSSLGDKPDRQPRKSALTHEYVNVSDGRSSKSLDPDAMRDMSQMVEEDALGCFVDEKPAGRRRRKKKEGEYVNASDSVAAEIYMVSEAGATQNRRLKLRRNSREF